MKKIGFIGMGNMAQALAHGFIASGRIAKSDVYAFAPNQQKLQQNAERIGFVPVKTLETLVSAETDIDTFIMACKPYQIESILEQIGETLCSREVSLVSVASGWGYSQYDAVLSKIDAQYKVKIQFVMPNTPAMVSEGVFLFEQENSLVETERNAIKQLFEAIGIVQELPSHLMGIGGAISGCGPAFVDMFIEAYADAAVKYGIPRPTAYELVNQTVRGSAVLCQRSGKHPGQLKDEVCSPGGTTICGVATLEREGLRNACIASIDAIMLKKKNG